MMLYDVWAATSAYTHWERNRGKALANGTLLLQSFVAEGRHKNGSDIEIGQPNPSRTRNTKAKYPVPLLNLNFCATDKVTVGYEWS